MATVLGWSSDVVWQEKILLLSGSQLELRASLLMCLVVLDGYGIFPQDLGLPPRRDETLR